MLRANHVQALHRNIYMPSDVTVLAPFLLRQPAADLVVFAMDTLCSHAAPVRCDIHLQAFHALASVHMHADFMA